MKSSRLVGAGAFVLIGLLLFTIGLFMIGERRMLFERRFTVFTEFATLGQLEVGAVVRVAGADAGEVMEISYPRSPAQRFRVRMEVRRDLQPLVRMDSLASTQTEGLVGAIFVNIASGTERTAEVPDGGTIPSKEPFTLTDLLRQASDTIGLVNKTVESMSVEIENALRQVSLTTVEARGMLEEIQPEILAITRNAAKLSSDTQEVVASIREGRGTIGRLINDDTLYQRTRELADQAVAVMANVRDVTTEARRALVEVRSKDGPAQGLMADMRLTLDQAREATADLADNMEALKRNFLFRGFFNRRGYFDLDAISPDEYRKGVLENGKRKAMRVWVSATVLFAPGADGVEAISDDGRARLDSALETYLKYLPSSPLVIEGYATEGSTSEQFRRARQRAGLVRAYLLRQFELAPQNTGAISLGRDAADSPDNGRWDGVALTLFVDRDALEFANQSRP